MKTASGKGRLEAAHQRSLAVRPRCADAAEIAEKRARRPREKGKLKTYQAVVRQLVICDTELLLELAAAAKWCKNARDQMSLPGRGRPDCMDSIRMARESLDRAEKLIQASYRADAAETAEKRAQQLLEEGL